MIIASQHDFSFLHNSAYSSTLSILSGHQCGVREARLIQKEGEDSEAMR